MNLTNVALLWMNFKKGIDKYIGKMVTKIIDILMAICLVAISEKDMLILGGEKSQRITMSIVPNKHNNVLTKAILYKSKSRENSLMNL